VIKRFSAQRTFALGLVLLLGSFGGPIWAQEKKVAEIVVTGNNVITRDAILAAAGLKPGDAFTSEAIQKARQAVEGMGYFSAVSARSEDIAEGVRVIIDVVENPVVTEIKVIGTGPMTVEKVLDVMRTKTGQVLNTRTLDLDVQAIQKLYEDQGYIAFVTEDIQIDRNGVLTVPILVHRVESIQIVGNRKTKTEVFLREMKLKPGDYFNAQVLQQDIRRIWNLDILEDIQTPKPEPGSEIGLVRVLIPVTEKKTGQVSLGLGYSSRQRLVGRAELSENNFRGTGQGVNLLWETGTVGGVGGSSSYEVGYFLPWVDKKHTSLSLSAYNKLLYRFSSTAFGGGTVLPEGTRYTERHKGGSATISRPFGEYVRSYLTLRGESVETPQALLTPDFQGIAEDGDVRSAGLRMVNNRRDYDLDPAAGRYQSISVEFGHTNSRRFDIDPAGTPHIGNFQKFQVDLRTYLSKEGRKTKPTDKRKTLAVRVLAGVAGGTLPFFEQFFVGGAETLRGYREDRFWGEKMFLASAEYRVPVAQSLTGVLFVDYGDAWGSNRTVKGALPQHSSFQPRIGTGVGIRVGTPIGNLRLDYGIGTEGARTHFSIGHAF